MDRDRVVLAIERAGLDSCIDGTTYPAVGFGDEDDDDGGGSTHGRCRKRSAVVSVCRQARRQSWQQPRQRYSTNTKCQIPGSRILGGRRGDGGRRERQQGGSSRAWREHPLVTACQQRAARRATGWQVGREAGWQVGRERATCCWSGPDVAYLESHGATDCAGAASRADPRACTDVDPFGG